MARSAAKRRRAFARRSATPARQAGETGIVLPPCASVGGKHNRQSSQEFGSALRRGTAHLAQRRARRHRHSNIKCIPALVFQDPFGSPIGAGATICCTVLWSQEIGLLHSTAVSGGRRKLYVTPAGELPAAPPADKKHSLRLKALSVISPDGSPQPPFPRRTAVRTLEVGRRLPILRRKSRSNDIV